MVNINEIKELSDIEVRREKSNRLTSKYKCKIPIVCIVSKNMITDNKTSYYFMLSGDIDIKYLAKMVKKKVKFTRQIDYFIMTENGQLLMDRDMIGETAEKYLDEDGFLYLYFKVPFC